MLPEVQAAAKEVLENPSEDTIMKTISRLLAWQDAFQESAVVDLEKALEKEAR